MQLKKIQELVQKYKSYLKSKESDTYLFWWESQAIFQQNWDVLTDGSFLDMYDNSLQNSHTKRLWKRESFYPKQIMSSFIEMETDFVKQIFKDLFNENMATDARVDRFIYYCDDLLTMYKKANPRSVENNHYHEHEMCFLYLAFRYPETYGFYNFERFQKCMQFLGVANIPQTYDVERFCKVCKTLMTFIKKDEQILHLHQSRLKEGKHYMEESMLLVSEMMHFV